MIDDGSEAGTIRLMAAIVMLPGTPGTESKAPVDTGADMTDSTAVSSDIAVETSEEAMEADAADEAEDATEAGVSDEDDEVSARWLRACWLC